MKDVPSRQTFYEKGAKRTSHAAVQGRVKRNVEPCPGVLSAQILPPCATIIFLQMAKPSPVLGSPAVGCTLVREKA